MDEQLEKIREDAKELTNPTFDPQAKESDMHTVTRRAIEVVRDQLTQLTQTYQQMMKTCNQRRDLFIVCVKFHMTVRQVGAVRGSGLEVGVGWGSGWRWGRGRGLGWRWGWGLLESV